MTELAVTLIRIGFLALLWIFVFVVIATLRRDIYGVQVKKRGGTPRAVDQVSYPKQSKKSKNRSNRNLPTKILVTDGPLTGTTIPLGQASLIVGRSPDSALVLDDSYSSARHARFFSAEGQWFVEDLQSTNGTYVHGQRIDHPTPVTPGDTVTIGQTTFTLQR